MTKVLLKQVVSWRRAIFSYLSVENHQTGSDDFGNEIGSQVARSLILKILALYLCEQKGITTAGQLQAMQQSDSGFIGLVQLWQNTEIPFGFPEEYEIVNRLPNHLLSQILGSLSVQRDLPIAFLGQVYEALLQEDSLGLSSHDRKLSDRKSGGIYYTPEAIVSYVLQMTLGNVLHTNPTAAITLLDPSCGCGAFLLSAYQFLLDWHLQIYCSAIERRGENHNLPVEQGLEGQWHLTRSERERLLLTHIYGVDLDPQAVEITKLGLYLLLLKGLPDRAPLPDLSDNIQCGNALIESEGHSENSGLEQSILCDRPFNWQHTFPEILRSGGFDLVIGNPPYLDSESMTAHLPRWRKYCTANYQTATGNWDLFCVFIEKALALCKPGGFTSLVVPNKLASANYAAGARSLLVQQTSLLTIRDYSNVSAFRAAVYPLVYVAQKLDALQNATPTKSIAYERMQSLNQIGLVGKLLLKYATQPWQIGGMGQQDWIDRLQILPSLGAIAQVTGAATVAEAYALQPWIQDSAAIVSGDLRLVNSGTIDRYCFLWGKKPLRYLGQIYRHPILAASQISHLSAQRKQQAQQPKIIVAGLSQVLESGLDEVGSVLAGKSTSVIRTVQSSFLDLRYLLGLLNSHLLSLYFQSCFAGNCLHGGYLRIGVPQLRQLPIWVPDLADMSDRQSYNQLIDWVSDRLFLQAQFYTCEAPNSVKIQAEIDGLDDEIDHHVYKLYQLKDAEIDCLIQSKKHLIQSKKCLIQSKKHAKI
ncbi:MAG: N-6 DNA methylase [Drouetiella hepatica Uher 2000/2452]|jgi:hypothetical protein|uniref:site-specific DNA-methyltransferase (adenine-specific) n=1 Tax=Drouetiella hepatica Uher 2000/2452 TaxID=904376 RepID=A0A951QAV6_9CYAN|nr:N-6 DNA methylase [Drouetiella hepatica Uher 2000/2452]